MFNNIKDKIILFIVITKKKSKLILLFIKIKKKTFDNWYCISFKKNYFPIKKSYCLMFSKKRILILFITIRYYNIKKDFLNIKLLLKCNYTINFWGSNFHDDLSNFTVNH